MGFLSRLVSAMIGLILLRSNVRNAPDTTVIAVYCNTGVYTNNDPFATSLAYVVDELVRVTPTRKGYDYFNISPYPSAFAYGHAACNQSLTSSDCAICLSAAKTVMYQSCPNRIGSRSVLHDCTIRYEQYPFDD